MPPPPDPIVKPVSSDQIDDAIKQGIRLLLEMQEPGPPAAGDNAAPEQPNAQNNPAAIKNQWPYEGVYRVRGQIPIGYRVGGTAIVADLLLAAPGYQDDPDRQAALHRALRFICDARRHPLMSHTDYDAGYDVRGWGYIYALDLLLALRSANATPAELADEATAATDFYLQALLAIEMPTTGGWNYARPAGRDTPGTPSSFMTAAALQTLFRARAAGLPLDPAVVARALNFLEKTRTPAGSVQYAGTADPGGRRADGVPGAVGRMVIVESTLVLAGRGDTKDVRGAVDAMLLHWPWLNARRAQQGTHVPPYGVAPYYFIWAHRYAAQAIELLPAAERAEYRRRLIELLFSTRESDGTWNDRVFKRSASYGTANAVAVLLMPRLPGRGLPPAWPATDPKPPAPPPAPQPAPASAPAPPAR